MPLYLIYALEGPDLEQRERLREGSTFLLNLFRFSGEKENSLKTDDYGRDLSSVQTLLTKQVSASAAATL